MKNATAAAITVYPITGQRLMISLESDTLVNVGSFILDPLLEASMQEQLKAAAKKFRVSHDWIQEAFFAMGSPINATKQRLYLDYDASTATYRYVAS